MADTDLSVTFSSDTSALNAGFAQARATVAAFAPGVTAAAKASIDAMNASTNQATQSTTSYLNVVRDLAVTVGAIVYVTKEAGSAWLSMAEATLRAEAAVARFTVSSVASGVGAVNSALNATVEGFDGYFTSAAYAQRGAAMFTVENEGLRAAIGRVIISAQEQSDVFGRLSRAFGEAWNSLRIYNSGIAQTALAAISAAGNLKQFEDALGAAGGIQANAEIGSLVTQLEKIPATSDAAAQSIITALTAIPGYTVASTQTMVEFLQTFTKTGAEAQTMAEKIRDAFKDQVNGGAILGDVAGQIKNMDALVTVTRQWAAALTPAQATSFLATVQAQLQKQKDLLSAQAAEQRKNLEAVAEVHRQNGEVEVDVGQIDAGLQRQLGTLQNMITVLENHKQAYIGITAEIAKQKAYTDAIAASTGPTARLEQNEERQKALQGNGRKDFDEDSISSPERTLALQTAMLEAGNQGLEGLTAFFNVLKNRLNANYGNYGDTMDDVLKKNRAFSGIDDASGKFDASKAASAQPSMLARQAYANTFGPNSGDDPTGGATHYYAQGQANPDWAGGMTNKRVIGDHTFGNPDGAPVPSDTDNDKAKESLEQLRTEQRALNAEKEGGTAIDKLDADQAQANLTTARDDVAQARAKLEALQKIAAASKDGTPQEQKKDTDAVTTAQQTLLDRQRAQQEAAMQLEIAQAQDGSEKKKQLETELAQFKAAQYAAGTKQAEDAAKEIAEIDKRYNLQRAADATETENATFEAYKRSLAARQQLIRDQTSSGAISGSSALSQQQQILDEELAREKTHFAALEQINAAKPEMVRRYELQAAEAIASVSAQSARDQENRLKEIEMSYKQHFEQIGSVVSSDLMGMLEGSKRFKDMFVDIAKSITTQFLNAAVKMAADWAAHQAFMIVQSITGQTAQTTAVATGEAARSGLVSAGSAAQIASVGTGMIKSILGSAAETFAGIFGFLSPVMGPAAIGPAVAGQAAVAAVASSVPSFDIGAWRLPSDMVAQVHAGEMIVPAGPAAMMRAAAGAGGAAGQSAGGGDTHAHFHVTAMDSRDVKRFFSDNSKHILGAIQDGVRTGSHLGFSKLRTS